MASTMTDKELIILFGIIVLFLQILFVVLQFAYQAWSKAQTEKILISNNNSTEKLLEANHQAVKDIIEAVVAGIASFEPHVERTKMTHEWMYQIKEGFKIQQDGIPLIYRNTRTETILEEITKTMHVLATTQKELTEHQKTMVKSVDACQASISFSVGELDKKLDKQNELLLKGI